MIDKGLAETAEELEKIIPKVGEVQYVFYGTLFEEPSSAR